jgi:hypothetical protein
MFFISGACTLAIPARQNKDLPTQNRGRRSQFSSRFFDMGKAHQALWTGIDEEKFRD